LIAAKKLAFGFCSSAFFSTFISTKNPKMKRLLLIIPTLLCAGQTFGQLCLGPTTNYPTNAAPYDICTADFNGDAIPDLATANASSKDVSIFLGTGTGTFGMATNFTVTTGNFVQSICSADFNNDGNKDIVTTVAYSGQNRVSIILGNGNGTFGSATTFTTGTGPISVCAGDFNTDGNQDVATCNTSGNNISVLFGNGAGSFGAPANYSTSSSNPYEIITADFNGDNKPDLATANNTSSGSISIFINQGTGTFPAAGITYACGTSPNGLCAGLFNADGFIDIAVTAFGDGAVSMLMGNGTGLFGAATQFLVGVSPTVICKADFNGDANQDVAITDYNGSPQCYVLLGDGAGNLGAGTGYAVGTNPLSILSGDFDANGKNDLAMSNYNNNSVSVILNKGPDPGISGTLAICSGNGTTLSGNTALTYSWSSGGTGQNEFVMPPTGNTSYTLSASNGACTTTSTATVSVTATPTINITGNGNICSGNSTTLTGGTATNYTWSSNAGSANTSTVSVSPTSTDVYTLTGANGSCMSNGSFTVNVTATPTVNFSGTLAICSGQSTSISGSAAGSYTWSTGDNTQSTLVSPGSTTNYTLTEANGTCMGMGVVTVSVTPTPTVTISGAADICFGSSTVLSGSGAITYTWSANAGSATTSTVSINPTTGTTYTLTGGNPLVGGSGECLNSSTASVNVVQAAVPAICMVMSDSMSINNIIIWDKTLYANVDSFIVYREVSTNVYSRIAAVSVDSLSQFIDTTRSVGPANGDPNIGYYRYKLQLRDTCGNYGTLSPYHTSIYFDDNSGTFSWNIYDVEGQSTPVANFVLRRDNANNGVYVVVGTVSGSTTILNDPNYGLYQTIANWRVDATGFNCAPTMRYGNNSTQSAIVKSKSNITNNRTTGVHSTNTQVSVYPNPGNGTLTVSHSNIIDQVKVTDMLGKTVFESTPKMHSLTFNLENDGIYFVNIISGKENTIKKIVVAK